MGPIGDIATALILPYEASARNFVPVRKIAATARVACVRDEFVTLS